MGAAVAMGNASSADRALYTASRQGDADKMRQALKDGANPNFVAEPHGWTPLHVSAAYNKKDGCRVLLTAGSDWSVKDKVWSPSMHRGGPLLLLATAAGLPICICWLPLLL